MSCCVICGSPDGVENAHVTSKGMGGLGKKAPPEADITKPLCAGIGGNNDPTTCHGAHHAGYMLLKLTPDRRLRYCTTQSIPRHVKAALESRGVRCTGLWHTALYEDTDFDAVDAPGGDWA